MSEHHAARHHFAGLDEGLRARFRLLVEARTGILIDERRDDALVLAVAEVAARRGFSSAEAVFEACRGSGAEEARAFEELVARLTVGETHFFRNRPHFVALNDVVFPDILERRARERTVRIWSAGCATGEEVHSLAMTLDAVAARLGVDLSTWRVQLIGTDIDREALDHARRAEYGRYSFRNVTDEEIEAFFEPAGERLRVKARHRAMVELQYLNLKTDRYPDPDTPFHDVDLIACRNVTIYFGEETTQDVISRFHATLAEGGYLLVGHSEHSLATYRQFQTRALPDVVLYQKGGDRPPIGAAEPRLVLPPVALAAAGPVRRPPRGRRFTAPDVPVTAASSLAPGRLTLEPAREALSRGEVNEAMRLALAVLESDPSDAEASLLMGQMAADRGHVAEAEAWLRRTLDLRPLDLAAHYLLSLVALERGDRGEALRSLERALYIDPDCVMAYYLRSRVQRDLGDVEAAARSRRTARALLASLPDDGEVPFSQGLTSAQLRRLLDEGAS